MRKVAAVRFEGLLVGAVVDLKVPVALDAVPNAAEERERLATGLARWHNEVLVPGEPTALLDHLGVEGSLAVRIVSVVVEIVTHLVKVDHLALVRELCRQVCGEVHPL